MTEQGTIYIQGWSNGVQELSDFSDIYVSCKYGWKDTSLGNVTQTGTITNKSLKVSDSFDFITFEGDSHTITATWDDEQYIGVVPVIYDVILTYSGSSPKLNKLSFDPTNDGWTILGDCETVDQGINSGHAIEFSNPQKEIHVETQTDTKAWSTTEPYFGTGVIADGAYYDETENTYIVIDGTNHPGQLSFSQSDSWDSDNVQNYSKQTSGSMFYMWRSTDITECTALNHYTWDSSNVKLCYDNTTELTVNGVTYTKQNPGPTTYDITTDITGDGTVSGINNPYASGDTATVTATANSGSHFVCFNIGENVTIDNPKIFYVVRNTNLKVYFSEDSDPLSGNGHWETNIDGTVYSMTFNGTTNEAALFTDSYGYYYVYDNGTIKTILKSTGEINTMSYNSLNNTITYFGYDFTWVSDEPQPTEKHIYLCDNSGAHLAEMTNTGSTWNVTGSFTSGMYSVRATVEGEYNDAWFKFYQIQGDNRIFVGAGDDPSFEDIGTYIMIDDILVSFSLVEDQETGYYVVTYQNTEAMTVSMVDTIVNSYIGDFVTSSDISAMGYMTATDISSMGYMTATDISSMSYITMTDVQGLGYVDQNSLSNMSYVDQTSLSAMGYVTAGEIPTPDLTNCVKYADLNVYAYVSQPALSAMSYVDNSYLSTYMNNVVGNIESILQTI